MCRCFSIHDQLTPTKAKNSNIYTSVDGVLLSGSCPSSSIKKKTNVFDKYICFRPQNTFFGKHISVGASTRFHLTMETSFLRISVMILMQREGKTPERIKIKHFMNRSKIAKQTYILWPHASSVTVSVCEIITRQKANYPELLYHGFISWLLQS